MHILWGINMNKQLFFQVISKFLIGLIIMLLLIFIPAGSTTFICGWILIAILFVPMFIAGLILMIKNPDLLKRRLKAREVEGEQKQVILCSGVMFLAAFIIAGLNYRFQWNAMPRYIVGLGVVVFLLSYALYAEVLRENEYLSRIIEVNEGQRVVDTGLYGMVRHPMYLATILLFLSMGIVLDSVFSFIVLLCYIPIIVKRIKYEEKTLMDNLVGYSDYIMKVKYRLIPFIW